MNRSGNTTMLFNMAKPGEEFRDMRKTLLEKNRVKNKTKSFSKIQAEESLFESMDEI